MKEVGNLLGKITDTMTIIDYTCQIDGRMFLILRDFLRFLYFFSVWVSRGGFKGAAN